MKTFARITMCVADRQLGFLGEHMMRKSLRLALLISILPALAASARADEKTVTFADKDALAGWTVTGDVSIDARHDRAAV